MKIINLTEKELSSDILFPEGMYTIIISNDYSPMGKGLHIIRIECSLYDGNNKISISSSLQEETIFAEDFDNLSEEILSFIRKIFFKKIYFLI